MTEPHPAPSSAERIRTLLDDLEHGEAEWRMSAALALGRLGDAAVPGLVEVVRSGSPAAREAAGAALGRIGRSSRAVPEPLLALLDDPTEDVRDAAARAIGTMGASAIPALVALLDDLRPVRAHPALAGASPLKRSAAWHATPSPPPPASRGCSGTVTSRCGSARCGRSGKSARRR